MMYLSKSFIHHKSTIYEKLEVLQIMKKNQALRLDLSFEHFLSAASSILTQLQGTSLRNVEVGKKQHDILYKLATSSKCRKCHKQLWLIIGITGQCVLDCFNCIIMYEAISIILDNAETIICALIKILSLRIVTRDQLSKMITYKSILYSVKV